MSSFEQEITSKAKKQKSMAYTQEKKQSVETTTVIPDIGLSR